MSKSGVLSLSSMSDVLFLAGNSGGSVPPNGSGVIDILGSNGVTVTGNPSLSTLTISVSGEGFSWNVIAGSSVTMGVNAGYITTNSSTTTLTLPVSSNVGDYITIIGNGTGQWAIAQNSGQQVRVGAHITMAGTGGSLTSANSYDSIDIVCAVANTLWLADGGPETSGFTIV
jgi:hypothetical protein